MTIPHGCRCGTLKAVLGAFGGQVGETHCPRLSMPLKRLLER